MSTFKLRGSRILLNQPEIATPVIELSPEDQKAWDQEQFQKFTQIEVFAVGDVVESIKPGDLVYMAPSHLQYASVIQIDGADKLLVREQDIDIIW